MWATRRGLKAQVGFEYMLVTIAMLAIVSAVLFFVLFASSSAASIAPQSAYFDGGISSHGFVIASNATKTVFAFIGSDAGEYPLKGVSLSLEINGANTSIGCSPSVVKPGSPFMCVGTLNQFLPFGASTSGKIIANAKECQFNSCSNPVSVSFAGVLNAHVSKFKVPKAGIVLSEPIYKPTGSIGINVNLDLFGSNFTIEQATLSGSNFSTNPYSAYAYFVNISHSSSNNLDMVNVSFAGRSANETFVLNTKSIRSLYCAQSSNQTNLLLEILLTGYYSQFIKYPANFSVFNCPLYNNTVYCVSNSISYFAPLKSAELGNWQTSNGIGAQSPVFACLGYESVLYCFTNSSAYFAPITVNGIDSWQSVSYPLFINMTSCSS
ncbi:MAG: hypothetical protein ACP5T4_00830 [Candidatus Micrarchaeia archaeon]